MQNITLEQFEKLALEKEGYFPQKDYRRGSLAYRLGISIEQRPVECNQKEFEKGYNDQAADFFLD